MTALLILIPVSIGMGLIGLGAFIWAMRHQQFDDPEGNAWRLIGTSKTEEDEDEESNDRMTTRAEKRDAAGRL